MRVLSIALLVVLMANGLFWLVPESEWGWLFGSRVFTFLRVVAYFVLGVSASFEGYFLSRFGMACLVVPIDHVVFSYSFYLMSPINFEESDVLTVIDLIESLPYIAILAFIPFFSAYGIARIISIVRRVG